MYFYCLKITHKISTELFCLLRNFFFGLFVVVGLCTSTTSLAETSNLRVGDTDIAVEPSIDQQAKNGRWLQKQLSKAKRGGVIEVPEGYYLVSDMKIRKTVKLVGKGDVIFQSVNRVQKGLIVPGVGVSLQVENITFRGASSPDQNGAGIRHDGRDLWVIDCIFEDNENGILSTGSEKGTVEIRNSTFLGSGYGDGYSHGIYLSSGEQLLIDNSRFIGTKIGHHIKSLARITSISNSYFDDAGAGTSYTIDVTRGGIASIMDNFIMQRETAENYTIINYSEERGGSAVSLRISGNTIINRHPQGRFFNNGTDVKTVEEDNEITNEGRGRLKIDRR